MEIPRTDELAGLSDEELVRRAVAGSAASRASHLDILFRRYERRVASWCLRLSGRREEAADLAQEVFLRVHERVDSFRGESSFSTWLYLVARSVTINRGQYEGRRRAASLEEDEVAEPEDPAPAPDDVVLRRQLEERLRRAVRARLEPMEARILRLHYVEAMTLPEIDRLLGLQNRSGAKAFLVSAKRKLKRYFEEDER